MGDNARWNLSVSKELDIDLRTHLAERGGKKGDLSQFVEKAVAREMLREIVGELREHNRNVDPAELQRNIDLAVAEAREERSAFWEARDWNAPYPS